MVWPDIIQFGRGITHKVLGLGHIARKGWKKGFRLDISK